MTSTATQAHADHRPPATDRQNKRPERRLEPGHGVGVRTTPALLADLWEVAGAQYSQMVQLVPCDVEGQSPHRARRCPDHARSRRVSAPVGDADTLALGSGLHQPQLQRSTAAWPRPWTIDISPTSLWWKRAFIPFCPLHVDQDLESTVEHTFDIERHRLRIHIHAWILHDLGIHTIAMRP